MVRSSRAHHERKFGRFHTILGFPEPYSGQTWSIHLHTSATTASMYGVKSIFHSFVLGALKRLCVATVGGCGYILTKWHSQHRKQTCSDAWEPRHAAWRRNGRSQVPGARAPLTGKLQNTDGPGTLPAGISRYIGPHWRQKLAHGVLPAW